MKLDTLDLIKSYIKNSQTENKNVATFLAMMMNELSYIKNLSQPIDRELYFHEGESFKVVKTFDNEGWTENVEIKVTEYCNSIDWGSIMDGNDIAYEININNV